VNRRERQGAILRLIAERPISTQSELAEALHDAGHDVVQTTVSRDIQELGLRKVRSADGRLVYTAHDAPDPDRLGELEAALRRWALSIDSNETLALILTPSGVANALAQVIDQAAHPHILGTVAGDNTILVVPRAGVSPAALRHELRGHLMEGAA